MWILPTICDNKLSLEQLARLAVGKENLYNINPTIPFSYIQCAKGCGIMYPVLMAPDVWEPARKFAYRLAMKGFVLADMGELAQFTAQYPKEVEKYSAVFALAENSRWPNSEGDFCVPFTSVSGSKRFFRPHRLDRHLYPEDVVLVFEKASHRTLALPQPKESQREGKCENC